MRRARYVRDRRSRQGARCALALLALLASCSSSDDEPKTAVQLVLTPDPQICTAEELLAQIDRFEVIVDAAGGLEGLTEAGPLPGGGAALDWDSDGQLEARFASETLGDETLPVLEIGLSDNADRELSFRIFGFGGASSSGQQPAAASEVARPVGQGGTTASIASGQVRRIGAPFNLAPWARPPRVLLSLPADGAIAPGTLVAVTAMLSTTVQDASVRDNVRLINPAERAIEVTTSLQTALVSDAAFGEHERSLLSITFDMQLHDLAGDFRIEIGPGIVSTLGHRFDQDPSTPQEEGFVARFQLGQAGGTYGPCPECPEGYGCQEEPPGCAPLLSCETGCPAGLVCDASQQQCVDDCRDKDQQRCLAPGTSCDEQSGLCR